MTILSKGESCLFIIYSGRTADGLTLDGMLLRIKKDQKSVFEGEVVEVPVKKWGDRPSTGTIMSGKYEGLPMEVRLFGLEKGGNLCVVVECGALEDLVSLREDLGKMRQTFAMKHVP